MPRYKYFDRSRGLLLTVRLDERLLPGAFEFAPDYLIDRMDLASFDAAFHNDGSGAPAYTPGLMFKSILYRYSRGIIAGRPIEQACKTNIHRESPRPGRGARPRRHRHFISSRAQAVKDLFSQVLFECHAPGLIGGDLFAIDGCKPPPNASKEWSGTMAELGKKQADWTRPMERIVGRHLQPDREGKGTSGLNATAA
jgi:transposase